MIHNLGQKNSVFNQFLAEIRDHQIQQDRMRFRRNMERLGEIFAYEVSKKLEYEEEEIVSPLGSVVMNTMSEQPVVASILRAGLPLHTGVLNILDHADNAFVSAYRKHNKDGTFDIALEYVSCPDITNRVLILVDPMLATGSSMVMTYKAMMEFGKPKHTHIISTIASQEGLNYLKKNLSMKSISVWVGAIDDELTAQSYIVPGLGDAGDLAYGTKSEHE